MTDTKHDYAGALEWLDERFLFSPKDNHPFVAIRHALKLADLVPQWMLEETDNGDICGSCFGRGEWDDAEPGDISFREFSCTACNGIGGFGLVGRILNYMKKESMGHDEVDAVAIANIIRSLPAPPQAGEEG